MNFVQQNLFWIAVAIGSGGMLLWTLLKEGRSNAISASLAVQLINRESAVPIDVRTQAEWSTGHLPGARHISLDAIDKHSAELDKLKSRTVILYCAVGNRSGKAFELLREKGFEKLYTLDGGIESWREANLPIEK